MHEKHNPFIFNPWPFNLLIDIHPEFLMLVYASAYTSKVGINPFPGYPL